MNLVFFGSFQHYSAAILKALLDAKDIQVAAVVTTPSGTTTLGGAGSPVAALAASHHLPVFCPTVLNNDSLNSLIENSKLKIKNSPDFFVTAGYGKLLPPNWLSYPKHGSLNLHFSLLPKFRGANPAEWAILLDEKETGITLITMTGKFDTGGILAQSTVAITPEDNRLSLYDKLYNLGAQELPHWLLDIQPLLASPKPQGEGGTPYAARFTRNDGFIDWQIISALLAGQKPDMSLLTGHLRSAYEFLFSGKPVIRFSDQLDFLDRAARALTGFPSLWTIVPTKKGGKRMKILSVGTRHASPLQLGQVHLEGYNPSTFNQIKNQLN